MFAISEEAVSMTSCIASVTNPVTKVVGDLFMRINKPPYPNKLFMSEAQALSWLREQMRSNSSHE